MKKFTSLFTALILVSSVAQAQETETTFVKSFNLQNNNEVVLDLEGDVSVEEWNNSIMRIQMTVTLENGSSSMLKSLVQTGRYNLKSIEKEDFLKVYAPGLQREMRVKGKNLIEKISYTIYAPSGVLVRQSDEASAAVETAKTEATSIR